jgi:hypothetical protein
MQIVEPCCWLATLAQWLPASVWQGQVRARVLSVLADDGGSDDACEVAVCGPGVLRWHLRWHDVMMWLGTKFGRGAPRALHCRF